jgi:hypothetical protein
MKQAFWLTFRWLLKSEIYHTFTNTKHGAACANKDKTSPEIHQKLPRIDAEDCK